MELLCELFLVVIGFLASARADSCHTPDGTYGTCQELEKCPDLLSIYHNSERTSSQNKYLRESMCGMSDTRLYCCPTDEIVKPGKFPWMAALEYKRAGVTHFLTRCGGVLIHKRYVLTSAHCILDRYDDEGWILSFVSLGIVNTEEYGRSRHNGTRISIKDKIVHDEYDNQNLFNDIGLIYLAKDAPSTNNIKPALLHQGDYLAEHFTVAGWGETEEFGYSQQLRKVQVPRFDTDECRRLYDSKKILMNDRQICAGGEKGKDACKGDSGGPLMQMKRTGQWEVVGLASFGLPKCGTKGWPSVYTKISDFMPWITKKISPDKTL